MGIQAFRNQEAGVEIESPFRRKKKGLQKLDFSGAKLNSCEQASESRELHNRLQEQFEVIMMNLRKRQEEFEQLKATPPSQLAQMHQ